MNDPIVDEIRRIRDEHARKFQYDLDAIFHDIKERQKSSGRQYVSFPAVLAEPVPTIPASTQHPEIPRTSEPN